MDSHAQTKPKRRKKKALRTQGPVLDIENGSDSDSSQKATKAVASSGHQTEKITKPEVATASKLGKDERGPDADVTSAFNRYYMQRVTTELAEDLDRVRGADDFQDSAIKVLISALQDGTDVFSKREKKRVVMSGMDD